MNAPLSTSTATSTQNSAISNTTNNFAPSSDIAQLVGQYKDNNGSINTSALAKDLACVAQQDFNKANQAYEAISQYLQENGSVFDAGNFEQDVQAEFSQMAAGGLWAANYKSMGAQILRNNPMLEIQWESTTSAFTNKSGFSAPLRDVLSSGGIDVVDTINPAPAGSLNRNAPGSTGSKNNINGSLAQDAIADRYQSAGYTADKEVNYDTLTGRATDATRASDAVGNVRRVDVEVQVPGSRPEMDGRILVESIMGS